MTTEVATRGRNDGNLMIEDARILFRNFKGAEGMYNKEGDRNFCVLLEEDVAKQMIEDEWNVKYLRAREEGDEPQPYIQVSMKYWGRGGQKLRPPRVVLITSRGRTDLGEDDVEVLDWVDIRNVDLIIRPFAWNVNGKSGTKAYLQSIYVTIEEDALELKYADVEEITIEAPKTLAIESGEDDIVDAEFEEIDGGDE